MQLSINSQLIASFQIKYAQAQEAHFFNIFLLTNNTDIVLDLQYYLKGIFNWKLTTVALGSFDMIYLVKMSYFCSFICSRQFLNLNSDGHFCAPPPPPPLNFPFSGFWSKLAISIFSFVLYNLYTCTWWSNACFPWGNSNILLLVTCEGKSVSELSQTT